MCVRVSVCVRGGRLLIFQNVEIFAQLDELDELDRITYA